MDKGELESLL